MDFDGVRFIRSEELDTPEEVGTGIAITLKNFGQTPADQITMKTTYLVLSEHMEPMMKAGFDTDKQFSYIMPSDHATSNGHFAMPRLIWYAIGMRLAQLQVEVEVRFIDHLKKPHSLDCVFESSGVEEEFGFVAGTRRHD